MAKVFQDEIVMTPIDSSIQNSSPTLTMVAAKTTTSTSVTKSNTDMSPDMELHEFMTQVMGDFENVLESFFNQWGLTSSRFEILNMLYHNTDGITPTETAKRVGVTNATISAILANLKQAGLVLPIQNARDSRSYRMTLSESGRELLDKIYPLYYENIRKVWSHFDTQEQVQMKNLLTRFSQLMGQLGSHK